MDVAPRPTSARPASAAELDQPPVDRCASLAASPAPRRAKRASARRQPVLSRGRGGGPAGVLAARWWGHPAALVLGSRRPGSSALRAAGVRPIPWRARRTSRRDGRGRWSAAVLRRRGAAVGGASALTHSRASAVGRASRKQATLLAWAASEVSLNSKHRVRLLTPSVPRTCGSSCAPESRHKNVEAGWSHPQGHSAANIQKCPNQRCVRRPTSERRSF